VSDLAPLTGVDHAEPVGLVAGHPDSRNGDTGIRVDVVVEHLAGIDPVDVVGAEDEHEVGALVLDDVQVLEDGVGGSQEPVRASPHLRRYRGDVVAEEGAQPPGPGDVHVEAVALVLGEDDDLPVATVRQVGEGEVDESVVAPEGNRRLRPVEGEGGEAFALTSGQHHAEDVGPGSRLEHAHRLPHIVSR
jgi:hypothetical protein